MKFPTYKDACLFLSSKLLLRHTLFSRTHYYKYSDMKTTHITHNGTFDVSITNRTMHVFYICSAFHTALKILELPHRFPEFKALHYDYNTMFSIFSFQKEKHSITTQVKLCIITINNLYQNTALYYNKSTETVSL